MSKSKEKYHSVFMAVPDAVIILDYKRKQVLDANASALHLYGYKRDDFLALSFDDINADPDTAGVFADGEFPSVGLSFHRKKDGSVFPVEISNRVFQLENQTLIIASIRDISERKKKEGELKQHKDRLDLIVNSFNGFIYTVSRDYKIEFINASLMKHIGYDVYGEYCFQLIHGLRDKCPWCPEKKTFSGETVSFERESQKDGRWYYFVFTPRFGPDGKVVAQQIIAIDIHERKQKEIDLKKREDFLLQENLALKSAAIRKNGFFNIVGKSRQMHDIYNAILEVAPSEASVLIQGESGVGKELVAQAIHNLSQRKENVFLPVNCGGIPENLIESEFFGYKKGAFTGAAIDKSGFLEIADGGTLFLDEIGEINLSMQVKLLRALDGDGYTPLGSNVPIKPDIRIISATNRNLHDLVKNGDMRSDFFYRIYVIPIHLPPLRKRKEDISLLVHHFLEKFCKGKAIPKIPPKIMTALENYEWPGNIRELQNIINRYVTLNKLAVFDSFMSEKDKKTLSQELESDLFNPELTLQDSILNHEKKIISHHLGTHHWKVGKVAAMLGINRKTLYYKIKKHNIRKF